MAPSLFKFIPRRYGEDLLRRGSLKITTLNWCRQIEAAGPGRADPGENTKHAVHYVHGSYLHPDTHPAAWDLANQVFGPGMAGRVYVSQSMFDVRYVPPDMYVYCTTSFPSRSLQSRWRSEDGDDVWIEIFDPVGFFQVLEEATRQFGQFVGIHRVQYAPRESFRGMFPGFDSRGQNIPPAILKPPSFEIEREWRGLWMPAAQPIKPELIVAPELPKFCRLLREVKSRDGSRQVA